MNWKGVVDTKKKVFFLIEEVVVVVVVIGRTGVNGIREASVGQDL
jgi:hypothetical protein